MPVIDLQRFPHWHRCTRRQVRL